MAQTYAAKYLLKAAASAPKDMINAALAKYRPIPPTVAIFHVTFVCDARCEMCSNWTRGNRKEDITLEQVDHIFRSGLWKDIEMANISGGEPTTRNDLVEVTQVLLDRLPKLRKIGINTTGLTPQRGIPMLTEMAERCHKAGVMFSVRVSIDGIGDMHNEVRRVKRGFDKASQTIDAMRALQKRVPFNFGISTTLFAMNLDDAENIRKWANEEQLDIVYNMVRFTDPMLGNSELHDACQPIGEDEERMRRFFMERVRDEPLMNGQNYIYMHYADMIGNGYHRLAPCPFQTQGIMVNPNGDLFFCENSQVIGNALQEDAEAIYFKPESQAHREEIRTQQCPTCLSPCQMNVAAVKQVVPYVKFLVRASIEKARKGPRPAPRPVRTAKDQAAARAADRT
jgi:MoaA/NifB/PqqE/SkfB family radical SAM enzyme